MDNKEDWPEYLSTDDTKVTRRWNHVYRYLEYGGPMAVPGFEPSDEVTQEPFLCQGQRLSSHLHNLCDRSWWIGL
jgi:hypothetical protein